MIDDALISRHVSPMTPVSTGMTPGGQLAFRVQCILFDIYGTLFISGTGDISLARDSFHRSDRFEGLLREYGVDDDPEGLIAKFVAAIEKSHLKSRQDGIDYPEVQIDEIWASILGISDRATVRRFAVEFELLANPIYPMPHLKSVLMACRESGIGMGIISNAQFYTPRLFEWFLGSSLADLGFLPELTYFSYETGQAKPSLVMFESAKQVLNKKNISTDRTLYVGNDMRNDIYPAQSVGFATALFAVDSRSLRLREEDPVCEGLAADLIITDLRQILNWLPKKKC
ncbi:MAG: HAD family hydrolase [Deltaproteobacteria bacterium]|nr:HAD family hydrolase [Deltaproteobacteria bacterium]